ncbi:MAG TPA: hypothetical protein VES40_00425, partial [Ilumatobacteraceae bacterium]|nr:hypothetical protein [Ilumatobacteraceae bacterium]
VLNRTLVHAESAATLAPVASVGIVYDISRADVVVNATNVGMGVDPRRATPHDLPCDPALLRDEQVVVDLVYHPLRTAWLAAADAHGARTVDGLGMLIHQAALQQERWIGVLPDTAVMRTAAEAALAHR